MYALIIVFLLSSILVGCQNTKESKEITLQIMASPNVNRGTPFYMVTKSTEVIQFYIDDYQTIAREVFFEEKGKKESTNHIFIPGTTQTVNLKITDKEKPLAVYFLFTNPGEEWKVILENSGYKHHKFLLEENRITATHSF